MKTKDFEMAIDALCCNIDIEEMKIRNHSVYLVKGHTESDFFFWDELGRAFRAPSDKDGRSIVLAIDNVFESKYVHLLVRDPQFDLKWKL